MRDSDTFWVNETSPKNFQILWIVMPFSITDIVLNMSRIFDFICWSMRLLRSSRFFLYHRRRVRRSFGQWATMLNTNDMYHGCDVMTRWNLLIMPSHNEKKRESLRLNLLLFDHKAQSRTAFYEIIWRICIPKLSGLACSLYIYFCLSSVYKKWLNLHKICRDFSCCTDFSLAFGIWSLRVECKVVKM